MEKRDLWQGIVGGEPRRSTTERSFTVQEPATGNEVAEVTHFGEEDVDVAVSSAARAFETWRWTLPRERGQMLLRLANAIRENAADLARLETTEMGKPYEQSRMFDLRFAGDVLEYFGGMADKLVGQHIPQGPIDTVVMHEPYGVVGAIIPFNWPPIHVCGKIAPALAAGNTVVIKPAEQAPLAAIRVGEIVNELLPPGVVNVVPGLGDTGAALVGHPGIGKVSFTGSNMTARHVLGATAENLTPAILELGGKNPFVVFEDADLEWAVAGAVEGMYFNQGEACTAASRILIQERLKDQFLEQFCPKVEALVVGDGLEDGTQIGPMVSPQQQARVLDYIKVGEDEGAKIVAQGKVPDDPRLSNGYFVPPTVFDGVKASMRIAQEEIFGPVATVLTFEDEDEAVRLANDSKFGLVSAVYTRDMTRANRVARKIHAGMVFVNNYNRGFLGAPFGGVKESGYGREHGLETIKEFTYAKAVRIPSGIGEIPVWSAVRGARPSM